MISSANTSQGAKSIPRYHAQYIEDKAYSNALYFIRNTVFLELEKMRSQNKGVICGLVIPPTQLILSLHGMDPEGLLKIYEVDSVKYIFHHRDLAASDIPISPCLGSRRLIEWGYPSFSTGDGMMSQYTARACTLMFTSGLDSFASVPGNITHVKPNF